MCWVLAKKPSHSQQETVGVEKPDGGSSNTETWKTCGTMTFTGVLSKQTHIRCYQVSALKTPHGDLQQSSTVLVPMKSTTKPLS